MIQDILITNEDLTQDLFKSPILIQELDVVTQDVKHMILESGLLYKLLAERSCVQRKIIYNELKILVESDKRIIPGTTQIQESSPPLFTLSATCDQGAFNLAFNQM